MNPDLKSHSNQQIFDTVTKIMLDDDVDVIVTSNDMLTSTGCADQENKVLYVSQLISSQDHLMPGLIMHEIGHFKHTPSDAIFDIVLNIIEDGYIERRICKDYLGSKKFLRVLFNELIDERIF